jgi:hypothetical protein
MLSVPAALLFAASVAGAQHSPGGAGGHGSTPAARPSGGHGSTPAAHPAGTTHPVAAASWNGTPSKWGGSPPERSRDAQRARYNQPITYIPIAVAAPDPVPASADPCPPAPDASVEMPVITNRHEERQLTTIEVYRLQPRFQKP